MPRKQSQVPASIEVEVNADAIAEGWTMVRIGTAIFGKRNYNI